MNSIKTVKGLLSQDFTIEAYDCIANNDKVLLHQIGLDDEAKASIDLERNFRSDLGSEKDSKDSLESFSYDRRKDSKESLESFSFIHRKDNYKKTSLVVNYLKDNGYSATEDSKL